MIEQSQPYTFLHMNRSDIVHFHEGGNPLRYILLHVDGTLDEKIIGPGYERQLVVPGGVWKATELIGGEWGLVGEAVSPGFDYRDRILANPDEVRKLYSMHIEKLVRFLPAQASV
jgi:predicted cupin superfamily sugar epimerase